MRTRASPRRDICSDNRVQFKQCLAIYPTLVNFVIESKEPPGTGDRGPESNVNFD
jgi:hypothetical protein